jgi:GNAT superfamily N-acetyltransferase
MCISFEAGSVSGRRPLGERGGGFFRANSGASLPSNPILPMHSILVRPVAQDDHDAWRPLWDGYNAFYGREGATAVAEHITQTTWQRFFDPGEPMFALVAEVQGEVVGLAHALFHRSMTRIEPVCYLSDLYTLESKRGRGIGRLLIEAVYDQAKAAGASRVYWQTHESNAAGRLLYDKLAKHLGFIVYTKEL